MTFKAIFAIILKVQQCHIYCNQLLSRADIMHNQQCCTYSMATLLSARHMISFSWLWR